jgi:endonuclease/exonuclease/phosphatase (EEP) superfamily protein YafD
VVRLFVQDRLPGLLAYCYYATPPIVLGGLATGAGLWWLIPRHYRAALPALAAGLACLVWTYATAWYHNSAAPPSINDLRVLFWNAAGGRKGWDPVLREIRRHTPDVVGLVEADRNLAGMEMMCHRDLPEYQVAAFDTGIALLAKGEIRRRSDTGLASWGRYAHCEVCVKGQTLQVVVVDLMATWEVPRWTCLDPLYRLLESLPEEPVLVIGDFNLPTDSVLLKPLRRLYVNAFEQVGCGYAATWPVPLPVLTLDQAWANAGLRVSRCELGWSWVSDHRPVVLEVSVAP